MKTRIACLLVVTSLSPDISFSAPRILGWGYNLYQETTIPLGLTNVQAVAAGRHHSVVLKNDGTVVAWGDNTYKQTNVPSDLTNVIDVKAGDWFSIALTASGRVVAWGDNLLGETNVPPGLSNVVTVAAGSSHALALTTDTTVRAWGGNGSGADITPPSGLNGVKAIAAGWAHSLALRTNGALVAWGYNNYGQTNIPFGTFTAIAAGAYHSLAVRADGTVAAWGGQNQYGEIKVPPNLSAVVAVAAGDYWSIALKSDGSLIGWGLNNAGQTTPPNTVTNVGVISAGCMGEFCLALTRDVDTSLQLYAGITLRGLVGCSYRIDFVDSVAGGEGWTTLTNLILPTSPYLFIDTSSPGRSKRFYRVTFPLSS